MEWQTHRDNHMRCDRPLTSALSLSLSLFSAHTHFQEEVINVRGKKKSSHGFKMEHLLTQMQSSLTLLSQGTALEGQNTSFRNLIKIHL